MRATPVFARSGASAFAAMLAALSFAGGAHAQDRGSAQDLERKDGMCTAFAIALPGQSQPEIKQLHAKCADRVAPLGPVTSFEAVANEALQAVLIDAHQGAGRRVFLVTHQNGGELLVEIMNGQIARTAGRGPMSDIDGIALDLKQFGRTGEVGVLGRPEDRARARGDKLRLGEQITNEQARRAAKSKQN